MSRTPIDLHRPLPRPGASGAAARRRRLRRRLGLLAWRLRFVVAAACCGLAALSAVQAVRPPALPVTPTVVAARSLPLGTVLTTGDVAVALLPSTLVPEGAPRRPGDIVGRRTAVGVPARTPLVPGIVAHTDDLLAKAPDGTVVAPVQLDGEVARLLVPGAHVDLLRAAEWPQPTDILDPENEEAPAADPYLARSALVLPHVPADDGTPAPHLMDASTPSAGVTLVAVRPEEAVALARATGRGGVAAVLVP